MIVLRANFLIRQHLSKRAHPSHARPPENRRKRDIGRVSARADANDAMRRRHGGVVFIWFLR